MATEDQVKKIISEQLGVDESEITPGSTIEDLGGDSLDCVELVMRYEEEFNVEIDDDHAENFKTVQNVLDYLSTRVS